MIIGDALRRSATVYPDKIAIIDKLGKYTPVDTKYTYRELYGLINRLANGLLSLGLKAGERVAVCTDTRVQSVISDLAIFKAGLVLVPLNVAYVGRELVYLLNDSGARAVIVDADRSMRLEEIKSQIGEVKNFIGIGEGHDWHYDFQRLIEDNPSTEPEVEVKDEDLASILYTSGTTGLPKGAVLTHRNWCTAAYLWNAELRFLPHWKMLNVTPVYSSGGIGMSVFPIFRGATVVLSDFEPKKVFEIIEQEKIDYVVFAPTMTVRMVKHPDIGKHDFSSLKRVITSAAPISAELLKEASKFFGDVFVMPYGTTETLLISLILQPEEVALKGPLSKRLTSVGKASLGYEVKVVDDQGNEVNPGGIGEIIVRGDAVAKGYWNKPETTDFRDGWWYSGDLAKVDEDSYLHIVDRKKDMIISGGTNIYPREIEDVLYAHPAIMYAAVIGVPDEEWGESVKAVVVLKEGAKVTEREIIEFCKQNLASYKKPKSVDIVESIPIKDGYKVQKRELRDMYRQRYAEEKKKRVESWGAI